MNSILFLHGFRSSPQSWKAQLLGAELAARGRADAWRCPQLSHDPVQAVARAEAEIAAAGGRVTLVGSSLGGYYATWLAEKHDLRAVLVNPAVVAPLSLTPYLGTQTWLHGGGSFEFTAAHVAALRALEVPVPTPQRYLLLLEQGDEVLDWRDAATRYAGAARVILPGGDHSFTRFPDYIGQILEFAGL